MIPRLRKRFDDTFLDVHRILDTTITNVVSRTKEEIANVLNED